MTKDEVEAKIAALIEHHGITDASGRLAVHLHVWGKALEEDEEPTQEEIDFHARKLKRDMDQKLMTIWFDGLGDTPIRMRRCEGME